jgi:hypothetical protein
MARELVAKNPEPTQALAAEGLAGKLNSKLNSFAPKSALITHSVFLVR